MHWSLYILIGAALNALINYGYKIMNGKADILLVSAVVYGIGSIGLFIFSYFRGHSLGQLIAGNNVLVPVLMGFGCVPLMYLFLNAIAKGPLTLVDPMWACIYALASAAIGLSVLKEHPSAVSLAGVGLYLVGAFLMAKG